jgi:hypothetical protein
MESTICLYLGTREFSSILMYLIMSIVNTGIRLGIIFLVTFKNHSIKIQII